MTNDNDGILAGLYRECFSCTTCAMTSTYIRKNINFFSDRRTNMYVLEIFQNGNKFIWKMFLNSKELSPNQIVELYAENNLDRLIKA